MEGDAVEGPLVCVCREQILHAFNEVNVGNVPGPSEVSQELIVTSTAVGIQEMTEICQRVLDGF